MYFCTLVGELSFIFAVLVILVRCVEKSSLLSEVIPSAFSSVLFIIPILRSSLTISDGLAYLGSCQRFMVELLVKVDE